MDANTRRYAVLKDIRERGRNSPGETLQRLAALVKDIKKPAIVQLRIIEADSSASISRAAIGTPKSKTSKSSTARARLELIAAPETWNAIVAAELSPIEAFLKGRLRVRGDSGLAQDLLAELAGSEGRTRLCGGVST